PPAITQGSARGALFFVAPRCAPAGQARLTPARVGGMLAATAARCDAPSVRRRRAAARLRKARAKEKAMPRGDKSKYTAKQKRKAEHIEESYESRGVDEREAAARAWATVNKQSGGGERTGRHKSAAQKSRARKDSARRAVATRHGHSPN